MGQKFCLSQFRSQRCTTLVYPGYSKRWNQNISSSNIAANKHFIHGSTKDSYTAAQNNKEPNTVDMQNKQWFHPVLNYSTVPAHGQMRVSDDTEDDPSLCNKVLPRQEWPYSEVFQKHQAENGWSHLLKETELTGRFLSNIKNTRAGITREMKHFCKHLGWDWEPDHAPVMLGKHRISHINSTNGWHSFNHRLEMSLDDIVTPCIALNHCKIFMSQHTPHACLVRIGGHWNSALSAISCWWRIQQDWKV